MSAVTVTTQDELDAALAAHEPVIHIKSPAGVWLELRDSESSHVVAWGSSHVVAWGSSRVEAWGSSHVEAWGSSHVVAWGSSRVVARGSSHVVARESSHVEAGAYVAIHLHSQRVTLTGNGHIIDMTAIDETDLATWINYHGAQTSGDDVILYKALNADLCSDHNAFQYPGPGGEAEAPDWVANHECGGGLHLGPSSSHATAYKADATRWLRCLVAREDLCTIPGGTAKAKARRVRVVAEVDAFGRDLAVSS